MSSSSGGFWPGEAPAGDEHDDQDVEEARDRRGQC